MMGQKEFDIWITSLQIDIYIYFCGNSWYWEPLILNRSVHNFLIYKQRSQSFNGIDFSKSFDT
jgi:hypothetical protein